MEETSRYLREDDRLEEALPELAASGALPLVKAGTLDEIVGLVRYRDVADWIELQGLSEDPDSSSRRAA
jgi:hypothetical protein